MQPGPFILLWICNAGGNFDVPYMVRLRSLRCCIILEAQQGAMRAMLSAEHQ